MVLKPDTNSGKEYKTRQGLANQTDGTLLREWKSGSEHAAEILVQRYSIRLVALAAGKLAGRWRSKIDPSDTVQSALGSFFNAARNSKVQISESAVLWGLLATFVRRKVARAIERQAAIKRGSEHAQVSSGSLDWLPAKDDFSANASEADLLLDRLFVELNADLVAVVELLLWGQTQREIGKALQIDERTVRRRLQEIKRRLAKRPLNDDDCQNDLVIGDVANDLAAVGMPIMKYNEFVLSKLVGSGAFGKVYRAAMQCDGQTVAVKFLRKSFWQNETVKRTFLQEMRLAAKVSHPHVLKFRGIGQSPQGGIYLVSDWIAGGPISGLRETPLRKFADWMLQICLALEAMHSAGVIHGDLTPQNVLVDANDQIKITDFGFSRMSRPEENPEPSITGGTIGFAAPEQIDDAFGQVDQWTDVYAVGGLVHWYLTGRPPNLQPFGQHPLAQTLGLERSTSECIVNSDGDDTEPIVKVLRKIVSEALVPVPVDRPRNIGLIRTWLEAAIKP